MGETVFKWTEQALGVTLNEMFGQTELNYIVGNCAALRPARAGCMGRAYPGHQVAVVDPLGQVVAPGETGDVAVNRHDVHGDLDPVFFWVTWAMNSAPAPNIPVTGAALATLRAWMWTAIFGMRAAVTT